MQETMNYNSKYYRDENYTWSDDLDNCNRTVCGHAKLSNGEELDVITSVNNEIDTPESEPNFVLIDPHEYAVHNGTIADDIDYIEYHEEEIIDIDIYSII